jgi:hypothetical protein
MRWFWFKQDFLRSLFFAISYIGLPALMVWGWTRWAKDKQPQSLFSILSAISLAFASAACMLSIATFIYARVIGGFPFYDPRLLAIYRWGIDLSLAGTCFGIGGAFRKGPLRQVAPISAGVMLIYWFMQAMTE